MKFFTAATLLVAAIVSALVCVPFMPAAKEHADLFALQVRMQTATGGHVQVYYDTGAGFAETQSVVLPVRPGPEPVTYDLPLPPGTYQRLRFDPIDRDAAVTVSSLQVVARDGRSLRHIALSELTAAQDVSTLQPKNGTLEVVPVRGSNDPQLLISLTPPLELAVTWHTLVAGSFGRSVAVFAALALLLLVLDRAPVLRRTASAASRWVTANDRRAVFVVAAVAVLGSSYPVVFLGKSYVSPNMGTPLLYETFPTLPGYSDSRTADAMGSDVGAIMWQQLPFSMVQAHALRHGELPLWNRFNSAGTPLLGQGQSMFGDPLHFLVIVANGAAWAWDAKYLIAKWLFAVGLGLLVLAVVGAHSPAREARTRSAPTLGAALITAMAAPFIGFFVYRFNHPAFFSVCYAPWPLYCWVRAVQSRSSTGTAAWAAALVLANFALMNSGTAKEAYMLLLMMNLAGAGVLIASVNSLRQRLVKMGVLVWAGVLFVLITAPIWDTFLHELRSAYTSYSPAAYQIQPALLMGAFDELFYRPLMPGNQTFNPSLNFVFLLGFLYFLVTLRTLFAHRAVIALATTSLVPLALAFGLVPPAWIVRVPFLANIVHVDNTFSCALIVLWAVLAGVGFAQAANRLGRPEGRGDLILGALLLFGLVFSWIAFRQVVHRPTYGTAFTVNELGHPLAIAPFIWGYLVAVLVAAVALAVVVRRVLVRRILTSAAAMLIALCAIVLCWRNGLQAFRFGFENYVLRPTVRAPLHAKSEAIGFVQQAQAAGPARAFGLKDNFFPGWNDAYQLETIHGPDALMSPSYRELIGAMSGVKRIWDWRVYLEQKDVAAARPYLDALNVRYYFDVHSGNAGIAGQSLRLVKGADLDVYESPTAWPRAFYTDRILAYDSVDQFVRQIHDGDGRPFAAMQRLDLAHNDTLASLWGEWKNRTITPATHYRLTENTTAFDVRADGPGAIVLCEAWWPGDFRAFVNGQKVALVRVNHAFKGVAVKTAGNYHVEFRYVPKGWYRNITFCGVGCVLILASGVMVIRGHRRDQIDDRQADLAGTAAAGV